MFLEVQLCLYKEKVLIKAPEIYRFDHNLLDQHWVFVHVISLKHS